MTKIINIERKKMKFKIGDRVGQAPSKKYNPNQRGDVGVVTDITMAGKYLVKWDNSWYERSYLGTLWDEDILMPSDEVEAINSKLEEEYTALETELRLKVADAARSLNEATQLAQSKGYELVNMYESTRPLMDAMDNAGWRTSSFNC